MTSEDINWDEGGNIVAYLTNDNNCLVGTECCGITIGSWITRYIDANDYASVTLKVSAHLLSSGQSDVLGIYTSISASSDHWSTFTLQETVTSDTTTSGDTYDLSACDGISTCKVRLYSYSAGNGYGEIFVQDVYALGELVASPLSSSTGSPTFYPSIQQTIMPTYLPTVIPTDDPTVFPTEVPTVIPTEVPTVIPTEVPTVIPTEVPTVVPSSMPTTQPSNIPSHDPTFYPTFVPNMLPSLYPTKIPSTIPTFLPTFSPTLLPTIYPTHSPTTTTTEDIYSHSNLAGKSEEFMFWTSTMVIIISCAIFIAFIVIVCLCMFYIREKRKSETVMNAFLKQNKIDQQQLPSQTIPIEMKSNDKTTDKKSINCVGENVEAENISVVENEKQNEKNVIGNIKSTNMKEKLIVTLGNTAGCDISEENDTSSSDSQSSSSSVSESDFESMYADDNDDVLVGDDTEIAKKTIDGDVNSFTADTALPTSLK